MRDEMAPVRWADFQNEVDTPEERNRYNGNLSNRVSIDKSTGLGFDLRTKINKYVYETQDVKNNGDLGDLVAHLVDKNWMTPEMLWDVVVLGRFRSMK